MDVLRNAWEVADRFIDEQSDGFKFEGPMSSAVPAVGSVAIYLLMIPLLKQFMKNRKPFKLTGLVVLHNLFLSLSSFVLLGLMSLSLYRKYLRTDAISTICDPAGDDVVGRLTYLYVINYMLKYYELIDTAILILKGKPVIFLHWFHHPATLILCWTQLYSGTGIQWTVIVPNLIVHTVMYLYYAMAALKIRCWWKRYITVLQIAQFIFDFVVCWAATIMRFSYDFLDCTTSCVRCSGRLDAAVFGAGLLASYLVLFIIFYSKTYKKPTKVKADPPMPGTASPRPSNGHVHHSNGGSSNGLRHRG